MLVLKNISKTYGTVKALDEVSLHLQPAEFVCVLGPSSAGKSTLLRLLMGAEAQTSGSITIDGAELSVIPAPALKLFRRKVGIVFQDGKLLSNLTVAENVAFPLEVNGETNENITKRVTGLLQRMHLTDRRDAMPEQLSAGQQARTAIARAVAHAPLILIADEPFKNLNADEMQTALGLFRELHTAGSTIVLLTADAALAESLSARVVRLENGRIVSDGRRERRTEMVETPELVKTHVEAVEKRRKVRVTAIHSE